jgi:hypothetical protein
MPTTTVTQIREGLATNLSTIPNVQISAYMLVSPVPPVIHVFPAGVEYDRSMHRGLDILTFTVEAFVAMGLDVGAQQRIDRMLSPTGTESVKTAIEADRTLGGVVSDVWVERVSGYRLVELPEMEQKALSADWLVRVNST